MRLTSYFILSEELPLEIPTRAGSTGQKCARCTHTKSQLSRLQHTSKARTHLELQQIAHCQGRESRGIGVDEEEQRTITAIIYEQIKQNKPVDRAAFLRVANSLRTRGCERLVLGCTELSLLKKEGLDDKIFVDSLDVLAYQTIRSCGKTPFGFPSSFRTEEL